MRRLTLYGRGWCHLCEEMREALRPLEAPMGFRVEEVDVESDPALEARYGERVPVLAEGGQEICHARLDTGRLAAHLGRLRYN